MKKIVLLGLVIVFLSGCTSNNNETSNSSSQEKDSVSTSHSVASPVSDSSSVSEATGVTFENTTLTTPEGIFTLTGSKSNESEDGDKSIFVTFDYENTTEENQNLEFLIWDYFDAKQIFPDTTETLSPLMYMDDFEYYDLYDKTQVEINPGATVQAGYGYLLKDADYPLIIDFSEDPSTPIGRIEYDY